MYRARVFIAFLVTLCTGATIWILSWAGQLICYARIDGTTLNIASRSSNRLALYTLLVVIAFTTMWTLTIWVQWTYVWPLLLYLGLISHQGVWLHEHIFGGTAISGQPAQFTYALVVIFLGLICYFILQRCVWYVEGQPEAVEAAIDLPTRHPL